MAPPPLTITFTGVAQALRTDGEPDVWVFPNDMTFGTIREGIDNMGAGERGALAAMCRLIAEVAEDGR